MFTDELFFMDKTWPIVRVRIIGGPGELSTVALVKDGENMGNAAKEDTPSFIEAEKEAQELLDRLKKSDNITELTNLIVEQKLLKKQLEHHAVVKTAEFRATEAEPDQTGSEK